MGFIPDLGVSPAKEKVSSVSQKKQNGKSENDQQEQANTSDKKKKDKKVVSYYLEVDLVHKIKSIAKKQDIYYSTLVTRAITSWIADQEE